MFMFLIIGISLLLFFVGATRRWFFTGAWRIVAPLVAGCLIGPPIAAKVVSYGAPPVVKIIAPIFASLMIACILKAALDELSKPPRH